MRTIAFYSYKGGNGKSLLAANLAVCLSRLGKSCVLVDWDLDAPSAHNKLSIGDVALGKDGLVGLMRKVVRNRAGVPGDNDNPDIWDTTRLGDVEFVDVEDLSRYTYEMRDIREREAVLKNKEYGRIHVLPAGDYFLPEYWNTTWSPLWRDIFIHTESHRQSRPEKAQAEFNTVINFLRKIKTGLGNLSGKPEYLLIDCRSGSSDLTATIMNAWIDPSQREQDRRTRDHLVYCLTFNQDSITYLDRFAAGVDPDYRDVVVPVLCRVPKGFDHHLGDRGLRTALSKLRKSPEDLFLVHSDRVLEGEERLRLGIDEPPADRLLTTEYLKLFERLLPSDLWDGHGSLAQAIGLPSDVKVEKERLFTLDAVSGALVNPADETRNVSFKVETFQLLLSGLEKGFSLKFGGTDKLEDVQQVFFAAGTQCGERFGQALTKRGIPRGESGGPYGQIQSWCSFDSDVGFGRFELDPNEIETRGQQLLRCSIILHESFLALPTQANVDPHKYCDFMRGYVKGVLEELLNVTRDTLFVIHTDLPQKDKGQLAGSCQFEVWDQEHRLSKKQVVEQETK
jgi:cellulose biosynthesis protein BcsQ